MSAQAQLPPRDEVEEFLASTEFSGYQGMPLPYGLQVPGVDLSRRTAQVLDMDLTGLSVLDVGTNYGAFAAAAVERGASRVVGLEASPKHYPVSRRIAELNGDRWEVRHARVEELEPDETFDVVLFLAVLHHVLEPVEAMRRLVAVCRKTLVVEFCLPDDPAYIVHLYDPRIEAASRPAWWRARIRSYLMRPFMGRLPLMAMGNMPYHRTYYFTPQAFENLFRVHLGFFDEIRFAPTVTGQRRIVAHCSIAGRS
jgi:SAM-dependent methyltransferase